MTEAELVVLLEEAAVQTSNRQAQIAAIKELRAIAKERAEEKEPEQDGLDELSTLRSQRAA